MYILAQFTPEMLATAGNRKQFTKNTYFESSRSFKVIDIDTIKKLIISACYDKQLCLCLSATISMLDMPIVVKNELFGGDYLMPLFEGNPTQKGTIFFHQKPVSLKQPAAWSEYFVIRVHTVLIQIQSVTDTWTNGRLGYS